MEYRLSTKKEIRSALTSGQISRVEFGNWDGLLAGEGESSNLMLFITHPGGHKQVEVRATTYGKLEIVEI